MNSKAVKRRTFQKWIHLSLIAMSTPLVAVPTGCNRAHYRNRADQEVSQLVDEKVGDASAPAIPNIQMSSASRMFDPFNPDRPPMPEDDEVAHHYMKVLNGKKHYPLWDVNGRTNTAENPVWWQYLPLDERGVLVLDANSAVRLAVLQSPNYQAEIETIYLSALDVSTERFFLGNQLFASYNLAYNARGSGPESLSTGLAIDHGRGRFFGGASRFSTGAELVVGLANSLTWQFAGTDKQSASTLLDFTFLQPLLRRGGRDVVMERLTLAERTLLYNVRAFERYRTGFYMTVTIGRQAEPGPTRRGGLFGGAGLEGFSGLGGGFGTVGNVQNNAGQGGGAGFGGGGAVPQVGGFLGLVQNQLQIRNAEENVARLRDNLARFEDTLREQLTIIPATQDAIPSQQLQVAQARQALISSQATLLQSRFNYEQTLDNFKGTLGLPPYICVEIRDPVLDQFNLISTNLRDRRSQVADLREDIGDSNSKILDLSQIQTDRETGGKYRTLEWSNEVANAATDIRARVERLQSLRQRIQSQDFEEIRRDIQRLRDALPERERSLARLRQIYQMERNMVCSLLPTESLDLALIDSSALAGLPDQLSEELSKLEKRFSDREAVLRQIDSDLQSILQGEKQADTRKQFETLRDQALLPSQSILAEFAEDVLALQVLQARARVESVMLPEVDIAPEEAVQLARNNRLDWMNARASLVDSWRAIEVVADSLESTLDVVFSGDITNKGDLFDLRGKRGALRAGLQWDSPLTRMQERNQYRQVLIEYQQSKRNYYRFEDAIWQQLRSQLRNLRFNRYNFELQRYAVRIAAQQIIINEDLRQIRESLSLASGPTAARDSVSALQDLLNAQNTFLGVWVFYEAQRRNLDQDLGTIRVDGENIWCDPGPITSEAYGFAPSEPSDIVIQDYSQGVTWGGGQPLQMLEGQNVQIAPVPLGQSGYQNPQQMLDPSGVQVAPPMEFR